uniref:Uncharacterized protein n=1 Tax=Triticum urartu TaxID=4572 RepID=A0A8R7QZM8_TRIUA
MIFIIYPFYILQCCFLPTRACCCCLNDRLSLMAQTKICLSFSIYIILHACLFNPVTVLRTVFALVDAIRKSKLKV